MKKNNYSLVDNKETFNNNEIYNEKKERYELVNNKEQNKYYYINQFFVFYSKFFNFKQKKVQIFFYLILIIFSIEKLLLSLSVIYNI